jgi:hypothetical protein
MTFQFWALLSLACLFLYGMWALGDAACEWFADRRIARRREQERRERQQWDAIVARRRAS